MERFWIAVGQVTVESKRPTECVWLSTRQVPSFVVDTLVCGADKEADVVRAARSVIMTATDGNVRAISVHVEPLALDELTLLEMLREVRESKRETLGERLFGRAPDLEVMLMTALFEQHGVETTLLPRSSGGKYDIALALTTDHDEVDGIARDIELSLIHI